MEVTNLRMKRVSDLQAQDPKMKRHQDETVVGLGRTRRRSVIWKMPEDEATAGQMFETQVPRLVCEIRDSDIFGRNN